MYTYRDSFLLAEETHSNVVPERSALGRLLRCDAVLHECHVVVVVLLHHVSCSQDRLRVDGVVRQCVAEVLERALELATLKK